MCLAHPKIGEREVLAALLEHEHHLIGDGQIMLADKGFAGQAFAAHTPRWGDDCCARTARTKPFATATSAASASGSNR